MGIQPFDFMRIVIRPEHFDAFVLRGMIRALGGYELMPFWGVVKLVEQLDRII
jgi:hypothetical protein